MAHGWKYFHLVRKSKKGGVNMTQWNNINISKKKIIAENERSILIAMPSKCQYAGYSFWHLKKLVREGRSKGAISIGFTNDFLFRLRKYRSGKYNKSEELDEIEVNSYVIEKAFEKSDGNIVPRKRG